MAAEEIRMWLEEEVANYPERASGEELYRYLVRRTAPLVETDRQALVKALASWLQLREESGPQTILALEIAANHHLSELRDEIEKLLNDVRAGKAFLPYYEQWVTRALDQI
jgi:hypothetical protein